MNTRVILAGVGGALLLAGALISTMQIATFFHGGGAVPQQLLTGAEIFRLGMLAIGAYMVLLGYLFTGTWRNGDGPWIAPQSNWQRNVFIALLIIATGLRLYKLGNGIWYDEMLTWVNYMPLGVRGIVSTYTDPNNHILYSVLARISLSVFGESVWAFRLPAAVFGLGSIVAIYYFARRVSTTTVALFSVALLTFSYHHIWFSQNARGYSALLFFSILSSSYLLDALRTNSHGRWLIYAATAALGTATHLTIAFLLVAHFLIWLAQVVRGTHAGRRWVGLFFGFIPLWLMIIQTYAFILPGMLGGSLLSSGLQGDKIAWTNPLWALSEVAQGLQVGFAGGGVAFLAVAILGIGMLDFARRKPSVVVMFLLPTGLGFLLMTSIGYTLFPRFFFFAMGFGVVIVMHGAAITGEFLARMLRLSGTRAGLVTAVLCTGIIASQFPSLRWVHLRKQNFEGAIELIENQKQPGDIVVTVGIADFPLNQYYQKGWETVKTDQQLSDIRAHSKRTWLVYTMPVHAKAVYPDILARIGKDYELVKRFRGSLNGGDVVVARERVPTTGESN